MFFFFWLAPEDDSSSIEENKTDPSCDDSQEGGQHVPTTDFTKLKPTPKPRFSTNNDAPLSSPEYNKKNQKNMETKQHFGETSNTNVVATKLNSCTSSEKSSDSGVSSSSSVCFGNMIRGKRNGGGNQLNNKNQFNGHLVQNVKDWSLSVLNWINLY